MSVSTQPGYYDLSHLRATPAYIHYERCWPKVDKLSPCEAGCPLYVDIPNFVQAIAIGDFKKALAIVREKNPLPTVCGYACWHPCEVECSRDVLDSPMGIQWLERYVAEKGNGVKPAPIARTKEEKVAIVGSGPAALTAAYDLVRKGYGVTIFEASNVAGGIPATAVPGFVLPPEAIQADIDHIQSLGVKIHTGVRIGKDLSVSALQKQGFKAILIACGAERTEKVGTPGADLAGVVMAMPFMQQARSAKKPALKGKVWVIGSDSAAIAAARAALRLGAAEVHLATVEAKGDRSQPGNIPAPAWELEQAEKEGVIVEPSLVVQKFTAGAGNKVGGIAFKRLVPLPPGGKGKIHRTQRGFPLLEVEGPDGVYSVAADFVIDASSVFQARRQFPAMDDVLPAASGRGRAAGLQVNKDTFETNVPGIFAVGDRSGTGGNLIEAMGEGRTAATSIDQYLRGQYILPVKESRIELKMKPEQVRGYLTKKSRWDIPRLAPKEAVKTFQGAELGYTEWQAVQEARRCLNCRMCGNCIFERGHLCKDTGSRLLL